MGRRCVPLRSRLNSRTWVDLSCETLTDPTLGTGIMRGSNMPFQAGTRLGPYELLSLIGAGGVGEVYRARDTRLDREVAIKVLPGDRLADEDRRRRFVQEAKAASALNHPHIVTIHEIESADGNALHRDGVRPRQEPGCPHSTPGDAPERGAAGRAAGRNRTDASERRGKGKTFDIEGVVESPAKDILGAPHVHAGPRTYTHLSPPTRSLNPAGANESLCGARSLA
jgi:hypothetical protein